MKDLEIGKENRVSKAVVETFERKGLKSCVKIHKTLRIMNLAIWRSTSYLRRVIIFISAPKVTLIGKVIKCNFKVAWSCKNMDVLFFNMTLVHTKITVQSDSSIRSSVLRYIFSILLTWSYLQFQNVRSIHCWSLDFIFSVYF